MLEYAYWSSHACARNLPVQPFNVSQTDLVKHAQEPSRSVFQSLPITSGFFQNLYKQWNSKPKNVIKSWIKGDFILKLASTYLSLFSTGAHIILTNMSSAHVYNKISNVIILFIYLFYYMTSHVTKMVKCVKTVNSMLVNQRTDLACFYKRLGKFLYCQMILRWNLNCFLGVKIGDNYLCNLYTYEHDTLVS